MTASGQQGTRRRAPGARAGGAAILAALVCFAAAVGGSRAARTEGQVPPPHSTSLAPAAVKMSFSAAVDDLVAAGYPQGVVAHLTSLGDTAGGSRLAGGTADLAQSRFIMAQMRAAGLQNVRLEPFPADVWEVRGAEVIAGIRRMTASQWAGVPGTPGGGITAPLVYVGGGLEEDYRAAGDVRGRIVLVDFRPSDFWVGVLGMEATAHGAAAMIVVSAPQDTTMFGGEDTLASSSATYPARAVPFVYVRRTDGRRLRKLALRGEVVTLHSDVSVTTMARGGVAWNVIGELKGAVTADPLIVGAHQDAFFRGAVDDASGEAGLLTLARAMALSGHVPERTVVFVSHSAEEFGSADSQYDWCIGSWQLMRKHPDWAGRASAELELDEIGYRRAPLWALNVPELGRWLRRSSRPGSRLWPQDWITSYSDQWAYAARGIPSVYFGNTSDAYDSTVNHTDADVTALLDFSTLGENVKTVFRVVRGLEVATTRLLPYAPVLRVRELKRSVSPGELVKAGCDPAVVRGFRLAVGRLLDRARAFERRARSVPATRIERCNAGLVLVERDLNRGLTALDWYDSVAYPHRTQLDDLEALDAAVKCVREHRRAAALSALADVGQTATQRHLSAAVSREYLARFRPDYSRLNWAAWGRLPLVLDVLPQYRDVEQGRLAAALPGLVVKRRAARAELERRLLALCRVARVAADRLETLR